MKKISKKAVLLFAILVFLFSISIEKAEAQPCSTGYTETTATFTYSSGTTTCIYTIDFCFQCSPTHGPMKVNLNWFSATDSACFAIMKNNFAAFCDSAKNYILENYTSTLCEGTLPCNQGYKQVYIYTPRCWQIYNDCTNYILRPCDDVYFCKSTYNTCLDYNYSPPKLVRVKFGSDTPIGGTPPCPSSISPPMPPCHGFSDCWQPFTCE